MRRRSVEALSTSSDRTASLLRDTSAICSARYSIGPMKLTTPVAMAFCGMAANSASPGSCANTTAPASSIARTPLAPSEPEPLRMTAIPSPRASATERKNMSTGARCPRGAVNFRAVTLSPSITSSRPGGMT